MQLILESERIPADPNKKMSVLQAAASVNEHLSGDPPIMTEPDNNRAVDGVIDRENGEKNTNIMSKKNKATIDIAAEDISDITLMGDQNMAEEIKTDISETNAELMSNNQAMIDDVAEDISDQKIMGDQNVAEEDNTDVPGNAAVTNLGETNAEIMSKNQAMIDNADKDISDETIMSVQNVAEEIYTDVAGNAAIANFDETNSQRMSKNQVMIDNTTKDIRDEIIKDVKNVAETVITDVAVDTAVKNWVENPMESTVETIVDAGKGDKMSLANTGTGSGSSKDHSENTNEEEEEPMEHLELSDNDDENDSKKSDNCSIDVEKEEDGIKANILESNIADNADILEEDVLMGSPPNSNKNAEPMNEDISKDSLEDIEKDKVSKHEAVLLDNGNYEQSESKDHTVDISDGKNDDIETEDMAVEVSTEEPLEQCLEESINAIKVKKHSDLSDMDLSTPKKMCDLDSSISVANAAQDDTDLSITAKLAEARPDESTKNIETVKANVGLSEIIGTPKNSDEKTVFREKNSLHIDSTKKTEESLLVKEPTIEDLQKKVDVSPESSDKNSDKDDIDSCERSVDKTKLLSDNSCNDKRTFNESDDPTVNDSIASQNIVENNTTSDNPAEEKTSADCEKAVYTTRRLSDNLSNDKSENNYSDDTTIQEKSGTDKIDENNTTSDKSGDEKTNANCVQAVDTTKLLCDDLSKYNPAIIESDDTTIQEMSATGKIDENITICDKPSDEKTNDNSPAKTIMVDKIADKSADKAFNDLFRSHSPRTDEAISEKCADKNTKITTAESEESRDCVMVDDDDDDDNDIMVIDEDTSSKAEESTNKITEDVSKGARKSEEADKLLSNGQNKDLKIEDDVIISTEVGEQASPKTELKNTDKDTIQTKIAGEADASKCKDERPLVALNFLNSFKTKITDMTRADLEEFCILKIVEGVVDRSNLSDIKAKLKIMMQNVEEWRKKAMVLNKQNRDLQIVLRTVQEEQKKRADEIITPLKITRSVGMQVLMTENKTDPNLIRTRVQKRPIANATTTSIAKTTPGKTPQNKNAKTPIPVPRLVPALNNSPSKPATPRASPQLQNSTITSNNTSKGNTTPNGVRNFTQKADKRSYSVSIDLTDDEPPPAKQIATGKGMQPPVRLVPSQQLMAPGHRSPLLHTKQNASNPRQVYIPIGPQGNIRPGQTIVFKTNQSNVRTRQPGPGTIVRASGPNIRAAVPRNSPKHPAPLPQAYQQPQPPNWKALPPAPDLKISKIENGIVVSWKIDGYQEDSFEEIVSYQLYAYQETTAPASTYLWNKIGDIKALPLPMACTLTQFIAGYKYYFAVRAVDARSRIGPFSLPGSILLLNK